MPTNIYQRTAMVAALAACFPVLSHAAGVARVDFAIGNVTAVRPDGRSRTLTRGAEIEVGDTVNTQQGRAQLRFADGAYMSLQPETSFKVDEFRFAQNGAGDDGIVMSLLKGGMRTITGLIGRANRQNYRLRTEVATIGIRGTEYAVRYTNSVEVFCAGGSISVENEGGTLVLGSGQGGFVPNAKQEPQRSEERPFLPPTAASDAGAPQEKLAEPVNPIQASQPAVVLAGKVEGAWAAARLTNVNAAIGAAIERDAAGALLAFEDTNGTNLLNTSMTMLDGSESVLSWGRWINGQTGDTGLYGGTDTRLSPLHWVAGLPTPNMPTGSASYSMIGSTPPSCTPNCSATLNGSSLFVMFDTSRVDLNLDITIAGTRYATSNPIPLGISGAAFSGSGSLFGGCGASLLAKGFFAGDAAARAGLAYHIGTSFEDVNGAIVYRNQPLQSF
jgi:hypothetical protein